jgi:hypothetical protein
MGVLGQYALAEPCEAFDDRPGARRRNGVARRRTGKWRLSRQEVA